jgi:hypothetical protein
MQASGKYIGNYTEWPELDWFENGMPRVTHTSIDTPVDYKGAFRTGFLKFLYERDQVVFELNQRPAFRALFDYVKSSPRVLKHLLLKDNETGYSFLQTSVQFLVESLVDRYIHLTKSTEFSEQSLLKEYLPLEFALLEEKLPVDIWVPILFLKFDEDETVIGEKMRVVRMSEDFHLARANVRVYAPRVHELVIGAASHALVLSGYMLPNENMWIGQIPQNSSAYPLSVIDTFFAAIRIVTGFDTGCAQLLLKPAGWARGYKGPLHPLEGTSIRRYPPWFENFYWNEQVPVMTKGAMSRAGELFTKLLELSSTRPDRKLEFAVRRLNNCFLREEQEDAILDATIGLEVLLSDDDRQEITYKLAMRVAALLALSDNCEHNPAAVFRHVKQVYGYRSSVVHGRTRSTARKREIKVTEEKTVPTLRMAIDYLRMILQVLVDHPEYLEVAAIDERLLLRNGRLHGASEG